MDLNNLTQKNSKPRELVIQSEEERISRSVLVWLNKFPEIPSDIDRINYETLVDDKSCMALSVIQGAFITRRYILGGYQAEYQFKVIYRIKPGNSIDKRLKADELLDKLGAWAGRNPPDIGEGIRTLRVEQTAQSTLFAMYENGDEDHQILMKLTYEVI